MKVNVEVDDMSEVISKNLKDFGDDVIDCVKDAIDDETKDAYKVLKDNAPVSNRKKSGAYKKSLKKKKTFENLVERRNTLYSKNGNLPHLIERSHATRNGKGSTKAHPHFEPAEKHVKQNLDKVIEKKIENLK